MGSFRQAATVMCFSLSVDAVAPSRNFGAHFVRHARLATGHLGMGDAVQPAVLDFLRGGRNYAGKRVGVRHFANPVWARRLAQYSMGRLWHATTVARISHSATEGITVGSDPDEQR
jgi:hypothetical protein